MAAPPTAREELSVETFMAERLKTLGIDGGSEKLYDQALILGYCLTALSLIAGIVGGFALLALVIGGLELVDIVGADTDSNALLIASATVLACCFLLAICFRAARIVRFRTWLTMGRRFDIRDSDLFFEVFEPVLGGIFSVAVLSGDGSGIALTPFSKRPISRYIADRAFEDRAFPSVLMRRFRHRKARRMPLFKSTDAEIVLIESKAARPQGDWLSYYLWQMPENDVVDLFDAADIYPGERVKRLRARVAVLAIRQLVEERFTTGDTRKGKALLKKRVIDRLKIDANARLQSGEINDLEARQLEQLNMGELVSLKKPEAWLNNLAAGDYPKILDPILIEARRRRGDFSLYQHRSAVSKTPRESAEAGTPLIPENK